MGILNYENDHVSGEDRFLEKLLTGQNAPVILDIGANEGRYTNNILAINPSAIIYAFEPHPETCKRLIANVSSPGFHAINSAAGNEDGLIQLYDYEAGNGSSHASLYKNVIEEIHKAASAEHTVNMLKLDGFAEKRGLKQISLLKIDTEGNELNVLNGFIHYINAGKVDAIHFEFNEMNVASRSFFRDFWSLLEGYDFYRLLPSGMLPIERYSPLLCELFAYQNIVALRIGSFAKSQCQ